MCASIMLSRRLHKLLKTVERRAVVRMFITGDNVHLNLSTNDLLTMLIPKVPKLSIPCLTNIIHATAYVQIHKPELMNAVIKKFEENIDEARIKDLERLTWALGIFAYERDTPIYNKIIESLRDPKRELELTLYPKTLPTILSHFSFANIFPIDLIKRVFDPEFLKRVYGNNAFRIGRDFFSLEMNIKIDLPEYDGPFLMPTLLEFLAKRYVLDKMNSSPKSTYSDKFTREVVHMCKFAVKAGTPISIEQVLPQYVKPDIILCFDEANNPVDPQPILSKTDQGYIKYVPDEGKHLKWIAVNLATQNQIIKGDNKVVGPLNCKMKQLQKIGYTTIMININDWHDLLTLEHKSEYIREKLCHVLDLEASKQQQIDSVS
ncbi:FAST kinase domain-containing protein 5, mitochondrial isoform X2 [Venturia canescens]|uniref:FAST kinase domain-containing protein 5, mitochondrial isoform X2 n=1 Tax=Venturia canescens TaxID=32260 RepID=UPI001C9C0F81|nr:FAST kinase domain-containing protein 5, mitochondrial isoform X2 [Venturia canescens]